MGHVGPVKVGPLRQDFRQFGPSRRAFEIVEIGHLRAHHQHRDIDLPGGLHNRAIAAARRIDAGFDFGGAGQFQPSPEAAWVRP